MTWTILGVCGSLSENSANLRLLHSARDLAPPTAKLVVFDGLQNMPLFNPDIELQGEAPESVLHWRKALNSCDAVLIASPEYGHSFPGFLKNAIDWVIRSAEFHEKVTAITALVPHKDRGLLGLGALRQPLLAIDVDLVSESNLVKGPELEHNLVVLLNKIVTRLDQRASDSL